MSIPDKEAVRSFLCTTKVSELSKDPKRVIALSDEVSVSIALKTLASHRFLAAPVISQAADSEEKDIVCFLDIRDILLNFLNEVQEAFGTDISHQMLNRMRYLEEKGAPFASMQISALPIKGGDGGFWHNKHAEKASIMEIIDKGFLDTTNGSHASSGAEQLDHMHRVALFGNDGVSLTSVITQSDVIRFLLKNLEQFPALKETTVEELGWIGRSVVSVSPELPALDALKVMADGGFSAVGVEKDGRLIGNFSMLDLRAITADHFCSLALPVGEFLALEHGTEYAGYACSTHGSPPPGAEKTSVKDLPGEHGHLTEFARSQKAPGADVGQHLILCEASWTLEKVLETLVKNRIHRVYVVGSVETASPITGLVTMSDVLKLMGKTAQH